MKSTQWKLATLAMAAASTMRDGTYWDATNEESTSAVMCGRLRGGHGRG